MIETEAVDKKWERHAEGGGGNMRCYDISISPLSPDAIYPNDPPTILTELGNFETQGYRLSCLQMSLHAGTHLDFPAHFIDEGKNADDYGVEEFFLPAQMVDIGDALTTANTMQAGEALLVRTRRGNHQDIIGLTPSLAEICVQRQLALVGIDQLSIDSSGGSDFPVHHILLQAGILVLENLDFGEIAAGKYQLLCLPIKTGKTEAAPARAILLPAILRDKK